MSNSASFTNASALLVTNGQQPSVSMPGSAVTSPTGTELVNPVATNPFVVPPGRRSPPGTSNLGSAVPSHVYHHRRNVR